MQGVVKHLRPKRESGRIERHLDHAPNVKAGLIGTGNVNPPASTKVRESPPPTKLLPAAIPKRGPWAASRGGAAHSTVRTRRNSSRRAIGSSFLFRLRMLPSRLTTIGVRASRPNSAG